MQGFANLERVDLGGVEEEVRKDLRAGADSEGAD